MNDHVMAELRKFVAPEFIFGPDARLLIGRYARKLGGHHVFLVSDPGVAAAGWTVGLGTGANIDYILPYATGPAMGSISTRNALYSGVSMLASPT